MEEDSVLLILKEKHPVTVRHDHVSPVLLSIVWCLYLVPHPYPALAVVFDPLADLPPLAMMGIKNFLADL
jgi:hypothetical protein